MDVNGSVKMALAKARHFNEKFRWSYTGVDAEAGPNVDVIVPPGAALPFAPGTFDVVVSSSALEHDPRFWSTFANLAWLLKPGGLLYVSVPSAGGYHAHPIDAFRFYPDAPDALAQWATESGAPLRLLHSSIDQHNHHTLAESGVQGDWHDHTMIFRSEGGGVEPNNSPYDSALRHFTEEFALRVQDADQVLAALTAMNRKKLDGTKICNNAAWTTASDGALASIPPGHCVQWQWRPLDHLRRQGTKELARRFVGHI